MSDNVSTKGYVGTFIGVFGYLAGSFNSLFVVLGLLMIIDYITGTTVAIRKKDFNREKGVWGAVKKLFYIFIVMVGFLADYTITYLSAQMGLTFTTGGLLGIAVTLYLIGNEGLSIIQNWVALDLPVPPFLKSMFGYIKDHSEKLVKAPDSEKDNENKIKTKSRTKNANKRGKKVNGEGSKPLAPEKVRDKVKVRGEEEEKEKEKEKEDENTEEWHES